MDEIRQLVEEIMQRFEEPYSEDIIDEVFSMIQAESKWLTRYETIVAGYGKRTVNPQIGKLVKDYTRLNTISYPNKPESSNLIQNYSKLGNNSTESYPEAE